MLEIGAKSKSALLELLDTLKGGYALCWNLVNRLREL